MTDFDAPRSGTGTRAWSESSYNIGLGCSHGCLYCYARTNAMRWHILRPEDWTTERVDAHKVVKRFARRKGIIMYPTMHDITPGPYLEGSVVVLRAMLEAGNKVLITTKPHLECVHRLCTELTPWRDTGQIMFRFTVGGYSDVLSFWEPGAPDFLERKQAIFHATLHGYRTSISMEPLLCDVTDAVCLYRELESRITDTIWLGLANKLQQRTAWIEWNERSLMRSHELIARLKPIPCWTDNDVQRLVRTLKNEPKVRWKESIRTVVEHDPALAGMMEDKP